MIKFKKLVFVLILCLFSPFNIYADSPYKGWDDIQAEFGDWKVATASQYNGFILKNDGHSDRDKGIGIVCFPKWFSLSTYQNTTAVLKDKKDKYKRVIFEVLMDEKKLRLETKNRFIIDNIMWFSDSVSNDEPESDLRNNFKTLYQQMLNAKESLVINTVDANDNKHSMSFSVKGLPEALMDFAERCGPEFQEFSGIKPNQKIEP